jgi:hypothetical protein
MILLVAYDLTTPNDTPANYELIISAIKSKFNSWCRIEQSVWLVDSGVNAVAARDILRAFMHDKDVLFVAPILGAWAGRYLGDDRTNWLNGRQF